MKALRFERVYATPAAASRSTAVLDHPAVEEVDGAVGVAREARVVGDHADGRARAVQLAQQLHHRVAVLRVEVAGGLVGEQDRGLAHEGAGHRHALLLTARELARQVLRAMGHAHPLEGLVHPLLALGGLHAAVGEGQLDVLVDREVADEVEALEDEPDLAVADAGPLGEVEVRHRPGVEDVGAAGGRVEQAQDREQRRLAAARRPRDRHVLAFLDVQVDPRQGVGLDLVGEEDLGESLEVDQRVVRSVHRPSLRFCQCTSRLGSAAVSGLPSETRAAVSKVSETFSSSAGSGRRRPRPRCRTGPPGRPP